MGKGSRVFVLDDGFAAGDPDVVPSEARSFVRDTDEGGRHGNRVCQVIASTHRQTLGMAPLCDLHVGRVLGRHYSWDSVREALRWVLEGQADVLNLSWAAPESDPECDRLLEEISGAGCLILAAHNAHLHWPHSRSWAISVGTDIGGLLISDRASVRSQGKMEAFRGPSVSCARAAGLAACARAWDSGINAESFLKDIQK